MATLIVTTDENYGDGTPPLPPDITDIVFNTGGSSTSASFAASQFGGTGISNTVTITGDSFANFISVRLSVAGTFSAAGWSFASWSANGGVSLAGTSGGDTLVGSAFNDSFRGGGGADTLTGGAGDDLFLDVDGSDRLDGGAGADRFQYSHGPVTAGAAIDGGSEVDEILLASTDEFDFRAVAITGVERVNFNTSGDGTVAVTFTGLQLRAGAIAQVIAGVRGPLENHAIAVIGSDVDLSGVSFTGWGDPDQTISITGNSFIRNLLTGSSQRETIAGTGNSADFMAGGGGADVLNGGGGDDVFLYRAASDYVADFVAVEAVNGGGGSDALRFVHTGAIDFRDATLASIEKLTFGGDTTPTVIFGSDQFGTAGISTALALTGDPGGIARVEVRLSATGSFSAAGWTFTNWSATDTVALFGTDGNETITGSSGSDAIQGGGGQDRLIGGDGDDVFVIGAGHFTVAERIEGGAHALGDAISLQASANLSVGAIFGIERLDLGSNSATLLDTQIGASAISSVEGDPTATQSLTVAGGNVDLSGVAFSGWGGAGQTIVIRGNSASSRLIGSSEGDTIRASANGLAGASNEIAGGGGADTLVGGDRPDRFVFRAGGDIVAGESINGGASSGGLDGLVLDNAGNIDFRPAALSGLEIVQFLRGTSSAIFNANQLGPGAIGIVSGSTASPDAISVNGASIDLTGMSFLNWAAGDVISLIGTAGSNRIFGSARNDAIDPGFGSDNLDGGAGSDTVTFHDETASLVVTLNGAGKGKVVVVGALDDTIVNIEGVIGGSGDDSLFGDNLGNTLDGGEGDDLLRGGAESDRLDGGAGSDTADYSDKGKAEVVVALLRGQEAKVFIDGEAEDVLSHIENVTGAFGNDSFLGDRLANRFSGGDGDDVLGGGAGGDTLDGGAGADTLIGGAGADRLAGNGGADVFDFNRADHSVTGPGRDRISGFSAQGEGDRVDVSTIDADTRAAGNQAFTFIAEAAFTAAGQLRFAVEGGNGMLSGNTDSDGEAEFQVVLVGIASMAQGDIVL